MNVKSLLYLQFLQSVQLLYVWRMFEKGTFIRDLKSFVTLVPVGVFGHRQTGKTTFTEKTSNYYITFDQREKRLEAENGPDLFLKKNHGKRTVIDECQRVPEIFPALKEWVRLHKRPGQFVLTGSVKFTSRKGVRESLIGRLGSVELLPLTVAEILENDLPDSMLRLIDSRNFLQLDLSKFHAKNFRLEKKLFSIYLSQGGLPGICFVHNTRSRKDCFNTLLNLMLDFDMRQILDTKLSLRSLQNLLAFVAMKALRPYSYAEAKRELKLSEATQKRILFALESIYLLRRVKIDGAKGELFLLEDQLEESILSNASLALETQQLTALYRNVRAQFAYRSGELFEFFQYRTRGGAYIPLAIKTETGILGWMMINGLMPSLSEKRSAESFIRKYPQAKVLFLSKSIQSANAISSNQLALSIYSLI